jgi:hypothetical protein
MSGCVHEWIYKYYLTDEFSINHDEERRSHCAVIVD